MGGNGAFFGAVAAHIKRSSWPAPAASRGAKGERLQQVKAALGPTSDSFLPTQVETNLFVKRGGEVDEEGEEILHSLGKTLGSQRKEGRKH